jgi:hypothetical protein
MAIAAVTRTTCPKLVPLVVDNPPPLSFEVSEKLLFPILIAGPILLLFGDVSEELLGATLVLLSPSAAVAAGKVRVGVVLYDPVLVLAREFEFALSENKEVLEILVDPLYSSRRVAGVAIVLGPGFSLLPELFVSERDSGTIPYPVDPITAEEYIVFDRNTFTLLVLLIPELVIEFRIVVEVITIRLLVSSAIELAL